MSKRPTVLSIQSLRGIASLMVVMAHAQVYMHVRNYIPDIQSIYDFGRAGVDVFFVISGFIMVYVSADKFEKKGASLDFFIRRLIRIIPMYWLCTIALSVLLISMPQYFSQGKSFDLMHFVASLFFIPWENTIGIAKPVLMVGWTLNFEMYFYIIFSFMLMLSARFFLPIISIVMIGGALLSTVLSVKHPIVHLVTSPLLIEFLLGAIIGVIFMGSREIKKSISLVILMAGLICCVVAVVYANNNYHRLVIWGFPVSMIVFGVVFYEKSYRPLLGNPLLVILGNSSYSLYLVHIFVINALGTFWFSVVDDYHVLFIVMCMVFSVPIAHVVYRLIEKPVTTYLSAKYHTYRSSRLPMQSV